MSPGATCFEQFRSITLSHHYDSKKGPCHHGATFCDLSILCAGGIPALFSLRLWLANRSPHSPADRRRVSKECQTHCTLLKYEINLERKPKTLRIERLRQLDRAAVKLSCNKLCQSVVNCVKTIYLDIYSIDRCWLKKRKTLHLRAKRLRAWARWGPWHFEPPTALDFCKSHVCFHSCLDASTHSPNTMHSIQLYFQLKLAQKTRTRNRWWLWILWTTSMQNNV